MNSKEGKMEKKKADKKIIRQGIINDYKDGLNLVKDTGCDPYVYEHLAKKSKTIPIIMEKIDNRALNILKQESLSCGADTAINEDISKFKKGFSNAVLFANIRQIEILSQKLKEQPFGLKDIAVKIKEIADNYIAPKKVFRYKNSKLDLSKPVVMGIVNLDPNSFSGDGLTDIDKAVEQAKHFEEIGAGIIDIGAESTRPGVKPVDAKTEIKRLIPALKKIRKAVKIPISIDTYKFETSEAAISEGADIINDIFALQRGKDKLADLIAKTKAGLMLMHMKGTPTNMQKDPHYKNCTSEVYEFLKARKEYALSFGIKEDHIAVDPGPGFGKTVEHNIELIKNIETFSSLGVVIGAVSRKRFIRSVSGEDKTAFITANILAVLCGADIIRVHDVKETYDVLKLIEVFRRV